MIMLTYEKHLKYFARDLRKNMPLAEALLWSKLRGKQVLEMRFNRQKPLLNYIVDFYCHQAKLVIECDGSQHFEDEHERRDQKRDILLNQQGILVLRFDNSEIITKIDSVIQAILDTVIKRI